MFHTSCCGRGPRVDPEILASSALCLLPHPGAGHQVQPECTGRTRGQEPAIIRAARPRPGPATYRCSVVEDDFHDSVDPAVEAVVQVRGLVQCRVVGDDLAGPGAPADDQVTQVRGVPAVVGAPESDRNALVEQRCPGHVQRPIGMASVRGGRRVGGGEHAGDAQPPRRIDQPGQVTDDLTGILLVGMSAVAGLEADSVDSRHHPAHLLRPRQGGAGAAPGGAR